MNPDGHETIHEQEKAAVHLFSGDAPLPRFAGPDTEPGGFDGKAELDFGASPLAYEPRGMSALAPRLEHAEPAVAVPWGGP